MKELPPTLTATRIPALWFDRRGCGPDEFDLELQPFAAELNGRIPASLGIRVRAVAGGLIIGGDPLVDGGFNLHRSDVEELHRQAGRWLAETAARPTSAEKCSYRVIWSEEDHEHVGLCTEFPSLSWLAKTPIEALAGIMQAAADAIRDVSAEKAVPSGEANSEQPE